jgi:hypothetical protein
MGLAVSQIRLLALTTRKADIELQMQVDSKRKQMLTRKSTELSQQYYSKLQDANVQYATSNGYEDVTYSYLMGDSTNGNYTSDFLQQIATGSGDYAQKSNGGMILTDQYGQVVLNNEMALIVEKAKDDNQGASVTATTASALWMFMEQNQDVSAISSLMAKLNGLSIGKEEALKYMELMIKNGGYQNGGTLYYNANSGQYVESATLASSTSLSSEDVVTPQAGYCYQVLNSSGGIYNSIAGNFYDGTDFTALTKQQAIYLGNLINYFGPMISAAIQNGSSGTSSITKTVNDGMGSVTQTDGIYTYTNARGSEVSASTYYTYTISDDGNKSYNNALNLEKLQAGFKSGTYQLCMVSDVTKGSYHKNTTLEYFVNKNYVVQKTDSSKREEITAWYNAEEAAISEKETYWDTEITNLSTELSSVNTEISSVKTLKSDAIKSVFDWGSS